MSKDKEKVTDLIPTKDEAREIISQVIKAQTALGLEPQNIRNIPVAIFQAWCVHMMLKAFDKVNSEYDKSSSGFRAEVERTVKELDNEIKSYLMK
jgi:hypothetical protein